MSDTSKALAVIGDYKIAQFSAQDLAKIIKDNVGDEGINSFDLDRIKLPTGGSTSWEIPTLEGTESAQEIVGVPIYWHDGRVLFDGEFTGESKPPLCGSNDGIRGEGEPGGLCSECPFSQWESDPKGGRGQACKSIRLLFIIRKGDMLPVVIPCPPTSIRPIKKYFLRLANNALPYYGAVTSFKLEKVKDTFTYSRIVPTFVEKLEGEAFNFIKQYSEGLRPALSRTEIRSDDYYAPNKPGGEED